MARTRRKGRERQGDGSVADVDEEEVPVHDAARLAVEQDRDRGEASADDDPPGANEKGP